MLAGDEDAFDEFFDELFPRLYRFALTRLNRDEDAAQEVAQATICKAITKLETYRGEAALFTWLCTFCRHEMSAYRSRNRITAGRVELVEEASEVRAALESLGVAFEGPAQVVDRREVARLVHEALDLLPSHYGDALEWKYLEDLPVKEIAARLGMSPKAAESVLTRARESFREAFAKLTRRPVPRAVPTESSP